MKRLSVSDKSLPLWKDVLIVFGMLAAIALIELLMGRVPFFKYGPTQLWSGNINSNQNSQQLFDPYTFTHITHGILLYGLVRLIMRRVSLRLRALIAIGIESAWEVFENTDMVINRYRAATISLDYYGDSVLNSLGDILAMILGFVITSKCSARATIIIVIIMETALTLWIRDGLIINMIMLVYPIQVIKIWQTEGYPM